MAYANKYKLTMATKSGSTSYLYLLEDGYDGAIIEYPAISIQIQYLPKSDNVFEPIVVSQLNVTMDVTDDVANMPNLTSLNDRKYLAQLYYDTTLEWQGWTLSDSVQFSFSTGRKTITFNCIDGLGLLENTFYPLTNPYTLSDKVKLTEVINNCLAKIAFPTGLNIISGISYYTLSMNDRGDGSQYEPLNQTYLKLNTILDQANIVTTTSNIQATETCLVLLSNIVKSFGAKLFQAQGKWWIVAINEFAQTSFYYTEYNTSLTVVSSGTKSFVNNIEGFTGNTSGLFFVDNSQFKVFRKGYNKVRLSRGIDYSSNYITNYDLKIHDGNTATAWTQVHSGTGGNIIIKNYPSNALNSFIMQLGNVKESVSPDNLPLLTQNESATFSINATNVSADGGAIATVGLKILLTTDAYVYFLDSDGNWTQEYTKNYKGVWDASTNTPTLTNGTGNVNDVYLCNVEGVRTFGASNYTFKKGDLVTYGGTAWSRRPGYAFVPLETSSSTSFKLPPAPYTGSLSIEILLTKGNYPIPLISHEPFYTSSYAEIQNFVFQFIPNYTSLLTEGYTSDSQQYVYDIDLPYGYNSDKLGFYAYKGFYCDSSGYSLSSWYRYEYPNEFYYSLSELVIKQYCNALSNNLINVDSSFMGMNTTLGRFSGASQITMSDTDPAQINVSTRNYMLGNSTIDLFNDTIQATLLDINKNNITATIATRYFTNTLKPTVTGFGHLRSSAYATKEEAYAAPLTTFLVYNNINYGSPSVGNVYYANEDLTTPFNGASLWWKIMIDDFNFRAFKISTSGVILEIYG